MLHTVQHRCCTSYATRLHSFVVCLQHDVAQKIYFSAEKEQPCFNIYATPK